MPLTKGSADRIRSCFGVGAQVGITALCERMSFMSALGRVERWRMSQEEVF